MGTMSERQMRGAKSDSLTVGLVAARLGIERSHVRALVESGEFPNAYVIPSAGRYGETTKIPKADVEAALERWKVQGIPEPKRTAKRKAVKARASRHLGFITPRDSESP